MARHLICRVWALVFAAAAAGAALHAQDRPVPSDSERVSLMGCSKNRTFIVGEGPEHEPKQTVIAPGRRFRLEGPKEVLNQIKARDGRMIEVTGLIRKAVITPNGVSVAGGRVQIGAGPARSPVYDPARDPAYNQAIIDVSSWRLIDGGSCK
jgi:hypothetical protein